jgi:hypothetical protein
MRIIFDENIPWPMVEWLAGHEVTTVQKQGWSGIANGDLIQRIDGHFDLFITSDKNLRYQQNLRERKIAILELPTNRLPKLVALKEVIVGQIKGLRPSVYKIISL